ncbi:transposase [Vibrio splendidus]|nr:transposase [Vibrio splendidus]
MVLKCIGGTMSDYSYFCGIDLAKNHFSLHAVDQNGKVILHKSVTRSKLLTTIEKLPSVANHS